MKNTLKISSRTVNADLSSHDLWQWAEERKEQRAIARIAEKKEGKNAPHRVPFTDKVLTTIKLILRFHLSKHC